MRSGHIVLDGDGLLASVDYRFGDIMHSEVDRLIGRPVLDITAPADRMECGAAIAKLRSTRVPFEIAKRFVRDDGSMIWVTNSVSMVGNGRDSDLVVATISPVIEPVAPRAPAMLLDSARMLVALHERRGEIIDRSLVSDVAWGALLAAYIAEAEGRAISIAALADKLQVTEVQASRWIAVLIGHGMIEIETRETDPFAPKSFRLTAIAHRRLEDHLAQAGQITGLIAAPPLFAE